MGTAAKQTRTNRPITIDFQHAAPYVQRLGDGKAFREWVLACILSLGFQRTPKATCRGGGCLTRHAHDIRVRLGGVTIWRIQCTRCTAVFTVLPHVIWRARQRRPEGARAALWATHGGLSWARCARLCPLSPMALSRLVCACGHPSLMAVLTRGGLSLPVYGLADETHRRCLTETGYLPTMVCGRVLWPLGDTEAARAAALTQSDGACQRAASQPEPSYRVRGLLSDGVASPAKSRQTLLPGVRLGNGLRHALTKLPKKLAAIASPVRTA
jgi:hypothetical protein